MNVRLCTKCQKVKKTTEFYKRSGFVGGYERICKDCRRKYSSKYRADNHEQVLKFLKERHRQNRLFALIAYGGNPPKCNCCGEDNIEFLSIDHVNNDGAKHRREIGGSAMLNYWLKQHNYPEGFQVLCYNCNSAKAYCGYCPHNKIEVFKE